MSSYFRKALRKICKIFRKTVESRRTTHSRFEVRLSDIRSPYRLSISYRECRCFCACHCWCSPVEPLRPVSPGLTDTGPDSGNDEAKLEDRGMGYNTKNELKDVNEISNITPSAVVDDGSAHLGQGEEAQSSLIRLSGSFQTHLSSCASLADRIKAHREEFERIEKQIEDGAYLNMQSDSDDEREWDRCSTWSDVLSEPKGIQENHFAISLKREKNKVVDGAYISIRPPTVSGVLLTAPGSTNPLISSRPLAPQLRRKSIQASLEANKGNITRSPRRPGTETCQKLRRRIRNERPVSSRFFGRARVKRRLETVFGTVLRRKPSTFSFNSGATEKANAETKTRRTNSDLWIIAPIEFLNDEEVMGAKQNSCTSSPGCGVDFSGLRVDRSMDEVNENDLTEIPKNGSAFGAHGLKFRDDWFSEPTVQRNGERSNKDKFKFAAIEYDQLKGEPYIIDTAIALAMTAGRARMILVKRRAPRKQSMSGETPNIVSQPETTRKPRATADSLSTGKFTE